jgi:hypothetical protein
MEVKKMKLFKVVAMMCCFVFVALAITPQVKADTIYNKKTILTFSAPFEVPGVNPQVLPAGTYMFKLLESDANRHIVQIFNADGTHLYTTILALPNRRLTPTDKTVLTFGERGENQPEAIRAWFYPGDNFGQEFVYPKRRAIELAKIVNEPVLAVKTTEPETVETLKTEPIEAVKPTGEEAPVATVVEAPPVAVMAQALPHTASSLPLFALIGLLSLCAGFTLLIITKRSA